MRWAQSLAICSAASIALSVSMAASRVRSFSARSFRWMLVSARPHTNRSLNISFVVVPNSQCSLSRRSCATKSATNSPGFCAREWKGKVADQGNSERRAKHFAISLRGFVCVTYAGLLRCLVLPVSSMCG